MARTDITAGRLLATKAEVAEMLCISTKTVEEWSRDPRFGFPQPIIIGRGLRFFYSEVEEWAKSQPRANEVKGRNHHQYTFGHRRQYMAAKEA